MADLAASAVTIERAWTEGGTAGKELSCRQVTLALTTQGTVANKITAAVLQLTKIEQSSIFITSDNLIVIPSVPAYDGSSLLLCNLATVTDANRDDPADYNSVTVRGVVKGYL